MELLWVPMSKSHTGHTCAVVDAAASLTVLRRHVEYVFAKFRSFAVWCLRAGKLGFMHAYARQNFKHL